MLEQPVPDLLISDLGMPEMDGYTLLQQIRTNAQARRMPAIALTAASPVSPPAQPGQPADLQMQLVDFLQDCWQADPPLDEPAFTRSRLDTLPTSDLKNLGLYLRKKGQMTVRDVKKS